MRKIQTQGVHHITLVGADRATSIDFWEGVLGMPFVFEQPTRRKTISTSIPAMAA
jgi:glyoxalase family protein